MIGSGAIIQTHQTSIIPDIPTGIKAVYLDAPLPAIPTDLVAVYEIKIPTGIQANEL